ncbi:MAG: alpha/beta hydrolase [Alphaproteobacteria bacterium]
MTFDLLPRSSFTLSDGGQLSYSQFEPATKPRGTVLVVPGRREFIEKKYTEVGQPLLDLGYRLIIVEPRGQGLSSRFLSGDERQRDHIDDFNTHINDIRAFYKRAVQPGLVKPLIVHGHSMGGHILLRWLAEDRPAVAGAFVTAPMLAIASMPAQMVAHVISWACAFGHAANYATPTQHDYGGGKDLVFADNLLTQDPARFPIIENYFKAHPDLTVGGVTWGWVLAALRSMEKAHAWDYLARIDVPVMSLVGGLDRVTPAAEICGYLNRIPRVRTHVIPNARHDLLNEIEPVLTESWHHIRSFLKTVAPA